MHNYELGYIITYIFSELLNRIERGFLHNVRNLVNIQDTSPLGMLNLNNSIKSYYDIKVRCRIKSYYSKFDVVLFGTPCIAYDLIAFLLLSS